MQQVSTASNVRQWDSVLHKQMGTLWAEKHNSRTRKGEDIHEWPAALHIQRFPEFKRRPPR